MSDIITKETAEFMTTKEYQDLLALAFDEEGRGYDDSSPNEENKGEICGYDKSHFNEENEEEGRGYDDSSSNEESGEED